MEDTRFWELFRSVTDWYELDPGVAERLLQKILSVLENCRDDPLQIREKYEILIEEMEREEL